MIQTIESGIYEHPTLGVVAATIEAYPDNISTDVLTAETIRRMQQYAREDGQQCKELRSLAAALSNVADIWKWVSSQCVFVDDEVTGLPWTLRIKDAVTEVLQRPSQFLRTRHGDCDDFSMLTAALCEAANISWAFVTVAADPSFPDDYSHVFVRAGAPGARVSLDTSHGKYPGWNVPHATRWKEWA